MSTTASAENSNILLSFDVEDWFQVENFRAAIRRDSWDSRELRVYDNTLKILDLLDSFDHAPKATFFILGWVARKVPELVRAVASRGHEVASHGYHHDLVGNLDKKSFIEDLRSSKSLLEDISGTAVSGYRAPNFSISEDTIYRVRDAGYRYDSSYNSFGSHGRYGRLDLSGKPGQCGVVDMGQGFYEVPVSNLTIGKKVVPLGGGGYFRLFPFPLFRSGMRSVLNRERAFVFYAHPWEFDPDQPRVADAPSSFRFRHYVNLSRTKIKLTRMIQGFPSSRFTTINTHIDNLAVSKGV